MSITRRIFLRNGALAVSHHRAPQFLTRAPLGAADPAFARSVWS